MVSGDIAGFRRPSPDGAIGGVLIPPVIPNGFNHVEEDFDVSTV